MLLRKRPPFNPLSLSISMRGRCLYKKTGLFPLEKGIHFPSINNPQPKKSIPALMNHRLSKMKARKSVKLKR